MMAQTIIIGPVLIIYWITAYNLYTYVIEIDYHNWFKQCYWYFNNLFINLELIYRGLMPPSHHPEINKYHIIDPVSITLLLVCCLFDTWLWVLLRLKDLISRVFLRVSELVIGISPAEMRENVCNHFPFSAEPISLRYMVFFF